MLLLKNEPLRKYTTFRIGGRAALLAFPTNPDELLELLKEYKLPLLIFGGGSNLLISDSGFSGLAINTSKLDWLNSEGRTITAGAGVKLSRLIRFAQKNSLSGSEALAGIPGTLGGAVFGNAGAWGYSIGELCRSVKVFTFRGKNLILTRKELEFSYRKSNIKGIIYEVELELKKGSPEAIQKQIREFLIRREKAQPLKAASAGSVFKNPPDQYAGQLIESCGLKGLKIGGAMISEKHANFIVNSGKASSSDVKRLIQKIKDAVKTKYNIMLEMEIVFVE